MKQILLITFGTIAAVSIIVIGFTFTQVNEERLNLAADLQYRTRLLADSLSEAVEPSLARNSTTTLRRIVDRFADRERIVGLAVFNNRGVSLVASKEIPKRVIDNPDFVFEALNRGEAAGRFEKIEGVPLYLFVSPLFEKKSAVSGALVMVQSASHIDAAVADIWKQNIVRLLVQIFIFSAAVVLLIRWALYKILARFADSVKSARVSKTSKPHIGGPFFLKPLANEIAKMHLSLTQARFAASEEARMRLQKLESPWTAERLKEFVKAHLKNRKIFLAFNREPYTHQRIGTDLRVTSPAGGASTALEPVMEACGGLWFAHGSGNADRDTVDATDKIEVPPEHPSYTLKRLWLTEAEVKGFHRGFATEGLWPLCHIVHIRPIFRKEDWLMYRRVNAKYAKTILEEIKSVQEPIVLLQDYHFTLLSRMIKDNRPDAQVGFFLHVPWPSAESFSICPWRKEILDGMLGADVIGFNTQQSCNNFIETVGKEIESLVDFEQVSITRNDHTSYIRSFPVSITFANGHELDQPPPSKKTLERLGINTPYLGLGVERLDYIKGIPERFRAIEIFLETHPEFREKFTFLEISAPHRQGIKAYQEYRELVVQEAERINKKFATKRWKPIVLELIQYIHPELEHPLLPSLRG
ncbi:MAG: trehalose 6-phosphate synthase, partial [Parcubacteria group bacterium Greene0416_79]